MAHLLWDAGARIFAVARLEEALCLRSELPKAEVLLLSPYDTEQDAERIVAAGITATVGSYESGVLLNGIAASRGVICRVHFKFDTGMGRFGFLPQDAQKAAQAAKFLSNLKLCGCFTHLSNSFGKNKKAVLRQFGLFTDCLETLKGAGVFPGMCHIANSNAAILYPKLRLDAVRCGSALLGRVGVKNKPGLKRVGLFKCPICETRWLPAGHNIGYADTFKTKRPTRVAVIPVGYADGVFTEKSRDTFRARDALRCGYHDFLSLFGRGKLYCGIGGKKVPIIGRVGMCCVEADVSDIDCKPGDPAFFDVNPILIDANVRREYV
jgi:alanine racemase